MKLARTLTLLGLICCCSQRLVAFPFQNMPSETQVGEPAQRDAADEFAIDPRILAPVRHPEFGLTSLEVRDEERDAYYYVLKKARDTNLKRQTAMAKRLQDQRLALPKYQRCRSNPDQDFPTFVDLIKNNNLYHGRLVTLRGHVRKLIAIAENKQGIDKLYEAWLYTEHSQNHPAVIVCTELPQGIPMGTDILTDHVSVTGYYFKNFGYLDQADTARYAPMILAQRLQWRPSPPPTPPLVPQWLISVTIVAGMAATVWLVLRMSSKDREFRNRHLRQPGVEPIDVDFENLPQDPESDQL